MKKKIILYIPFLLFFSIFFINSVSAADPGYLRGKTICMDYNFSFNGNMQRWDEQQSCRNSATEPTDNNINTGSYGGGGSLGSIGTSTSVMFYTFPSVQNIGQYIVKGDATQIYTMYLYNSSRTLLASISINKNYELTSTPTSVIGVKYAALHNTGTTSFGLMEWDLYGPPPDFIPPAVPTGLITTQGVESVSLNWNANSEIDLAGYNIYANGLKQNAILINGTTYNAINLLPDSNYLFQVSSVDISGNESNKSLAVSGQSMSQPLSPTLLSSNLEDDSVRLTWDDTAVTYEIFKDGVFYDSTINLFDYVTLLTPNTAYSLYVVGVDQYGRRNQSNTLNIMTLPPQPSAPSLTVTNKTQNAFTVSWSATGFTNDYSIYLNNSLVMTANVLTYTFSSLIPNTLYTFKVVANGQNGTSESSGSARTNEIPVPKINNASVTPVSGQPTKRNLTYEANEHVTTVKVYVNGALIGEYPVSQNSIELDMSGITGQFANVTLTPSDPNASTYELSTLAQSTGDESIDNLIAKFLNAFNITRNSFWYIAIASISVILAVALFFFLRHKYKKLVGSPKKEDKFLNAKLNPNQEKVDHREEKRKFIPWKSMTDDQKNEWRERKGHKTKIPFSEKDKLELRSKKHEEQTGFKIVERQVRVTGTGFLGLTAAKSKEHLTFERNGIRYKQQYVKGQGKVFVPKDFDNKIKHVSSQFKAFKVFTGSNKKF